MTVQHSLHFSWSSGNQTGPCKRQASVLAHILCLGLTFAAFILLQICLRVQVSGGWPGTIWTLLLKMGVQFHQGCCDQNFTNAEKPEHENPEQ